MYLEDKLLNQTINLIPTEFIKELQEFRKYFYNNLENFPITLEGLRPLSDFSLKVLYSGIDHLW